MTIEGRENDGAPSPFDGVDHLVALTSARKRLLEALEDLDETAAATVVHGEWRVRDLMSHLASWDRLVHAFLQDIAAGRRSFDVTVTPDDDWGAWNAGQVSREASTALVTRAAELEGARDALLDAIYALDRETLDLELLAPWGFVDTVLGHVVTQAVHDALHTDQILAALNPH